jgi:ABC-type nickel/cobalt efflux system permease component RcnA
VNAVQNLALFYVIPVALWLVVLLILLRVWLTGRLQDSLAYLVYLRERKALFISLLVALACTRAVTAAFNIAMGLGWVVGSTTAEAVAVLSAIVGAILVLLFAWFLLWRGPTRKSRTLVLDVPDHLMYSLGVLDEAERSRQNESP